MVTGSKTPVLKAQGWATSGMGALCPGGHMWPIKFLSGLPFKEIILIVIKSVKWLYFIHVVSVLSVI